MRYAQSLSKSLFYSPLNPPVPPGLPELLGPPLKVRPWIRVPLLTPHSKRLLPSQPSQRLWQSTTARREPSGVKKCKQYDRYLGDDHHHTVRDMNC
eukprot:sb/3479178/